MGVAWHEVLEYATPRGVVHIGGHTGEEAHNYTSCGVNVVWIEANPFWAALMSERVSKYGQTSWCACLSDTDGEQVEFNVTNDEWASSFLTPGYHAVQNPHVKIVERMPLCTRRYDALAPHWADLDINMAVLDVQGAELKVLVGMGVYLDGFDILVIEYSTVPDFYIGAPTLADLDDYLTDFTRVLGGDDIHGDALWIRSSLL